MNRIDRHTLCLKKVPTFKLSVTLSNLNRFSKFCTARKCMKCATKPIWHCPSHLKHVATLEKLKIQIFCRYSAIPDMEENANKLHFKCTNFNSFAHVTVYDVCIYVFLSQSCPRHWISCWSSTNTAATSAVTYFGCHKLITRVNK